MSYADTLLNSAHLHSSKHRDEVEASGIAACFFCLETFPPQAIDRWLNEGTGTAVCPQCQIDSVLGDASGLPVSEPGFLKAMQNRWFGELAEDET